MTKYNDKFFPKKAHNFIQFAHIHLKHTKLYNNKKNTSYKAKKYEAIRANREYTKQRAW